MQQKYSMLKNKETKNIQEDTIFLSFLILHSIQLKGCDGLETIIYYYPSEKEDLGSIMTSQITQSLSLLSNSDDTT